MCAAWGAHRGVTSIPGAGHTSGHAHAHCIHGVWFLKLTPALIHILLLPTAARKLGARPGDPLRAEAAARSGLWPSARGSSGTACRKRGRLPHGVPERSAETPSPPGALTVSSPCATRSTGLINDFAGDPSASRRPHFPLCLTVQPPREKPHLLTPNHHHGKGVIKPGPREASRKEEQRLSPAAWVPSRGAAQGSPRFVTPPRASLLKASGEERGAHRFTSSSRLEAMSGTPGHLLEPQLVHEGPPGATVQVTGPARCEATPAGPQLCQT